MVCTAPRMLPADGLVVAWFHAEPQKISCTGRPVPIAPPPLDTEMGPGMIGGEGKVGGKDFLRGDAAKFSTAFGDDATREAPALVLATDIFPSANCNLAY